MTGAELIKAIHAYHLENCEIMTQKPFTQHGDYLEFSDPNDTRFNKILWITDDYLQDVIFNEAGDLTYREVEDSQLNHIKMFSSLSLIFYTSLNRCRCQRKETHE